MGRNKEHSSNDSYRLSFGNKPIALCASIFMVILSCNYKRLVGQGGSKSEGLAPMLCRDGYKYQNTNT